MKHMPKTEAALDTFLKTVGPRPDYLTKLNLKQRAEEANKAIEGLASAMKRDFLAVGISFDNKESQALARAEENNLYSITLEFTAMMTDKSRGAYIFSTAMYVRDDGKFSASFDLSGLKGNDTKPVVATDTQNWPEYRSKLLAFFKNLDEYGFKLKP